MVAAVKIAPVRRPPPRSDADRVAALLDLPARASDLLLVEAIERGLPVAAAEAIVAALDPSGDALPVTALVPKATYHRAKKLRQPLSRDQSERLLAFARVAAEALRQSSVTSTAPRLTIEPGRTSTVST